MPERGQFISDEDFLALKSLIDAEIGRRGKTEGTAQGQSVGSMAAYRGAAYQYNVTPADGLSVDAEHIQKITRLVDAVQGSATTPERGDQVAASGLAQAAATVSTLSNIPETATATGCGGQCTGLCSRKRPAALSTVEGRWLEGPYHMGMRTEKENVGRKTISFVQRD